MNKRQLLRATALVASSLLLAGTASAQDFPPKKPVTLVVGFAAGGAADAAARLIAKKLGENIGQTVVVDNKGGAGGNIAHQFVANAAPDGTVLLFGSVGPLTIAPHLMKLTYDPFKDLAAISGGVNFPNVLVVHKAQGAKTLAEFIQLSKKKPGSVEFASTGAGSASHLAGELFNQRAGIDMTHVPYKGGAPALQDLLGERITSYFAAPPTAMPHVESGKLIPLATTGLTRPAYLPNIPTVAESGFPGFEALNWYAFVAPGKTPAPLLDRWNQEIVKVLSQIGAAVRKGTPKPDISTVAALTQTLLNAKSVAYSASASGVYLSTEMFAKLGVQERLAVTGKKILSERVGAVVARGDAELGFQQVSELIYFKELDFIGTLPDEVQQTIFFSAGLVEGAAQPELARHLLRFLTSPAVADIVRATGLDPVDQRAVQASAAKPQ
jgi:tripartite-type tricarboxylate transporter receptor subunit TctC